MEKYKCILCKNEYKKNHNVGLVFNIFKKKSYDHDKILCLPCYNKGFDESSDEVIKILEELRKPKFIIYSDNKPIMECTKEELNINLEYHKKNMPNVTFKEV